MSRSLIVLPEDSANPILDAINRSSKMLRIKMFLLSDPAMLNALIGAHGRGVKVRIMLNPARRNGEVENEASRRLLSEAGVEVIDSNPAFDLTHEKSLIVDDTEALVQSLNWQTKNFVGTRDLAVLTTHRHEVREIAECFEADWNRVDFTRRELPNLIWCTGSGRDRLAEFIDRATHNLFVENERYQDPVIIERLVRAKRRGVKVHVLARPPHKLKKDKLVEAVTGLRIMDAVGIKIHKLKHLTLHAKMLFEDNAAAIIGSINLAPGSFDSRRELAIEVRDDHILNRLHHLVHEDWANSNPLDLTDEGLLADLEAHHKDGADQLALHPKHKA
jgi:cardiolipin synthase